jgi:hypothetical protein
MGELSMILRSLLMLIACTFAWFSMNSTGCSESRLPTTGPCKGDGCKRALITALQELSRIETNEKGELGESQRAEIKAVVGRFTEPQSVANLALLSKAMGATCADVVCSKESKLETTYETAFWYSVKVLAENKASNKNVLASLKHQAALNDTDKGEWERIVEGKEFP